MSLSNGLSCETGSFPHCHNPHRCFAAGGFESLVSHSETLGFEVCLTPPLFLLAYLHANVGSPGWAAALLCHVSSLPRLLMSTPPSGLVECFFTPWCRISMQFDFLEFCLFFVFKLVIILLLVGWESEVFLPMPLSWPELRRLPFWGKDFISFLNLGTELNFWKSYVKSKTASLTLPLGNSLPTHWELGLTSYFVSQYYSFHPKVTNYFIFSDKNIK